MNRRRRSASAGTALCAALLLWATSAFAVLLPARTPNLAPNRGQVWVAKVIYPTLARAAPSTAARGLGFVSTVSPWGTPVALLVRGAHVDAAGLPWVRVLLDKRPNGVAAWIDAQDAVLYRDPWWISVSRAARELKVYREGQLQRVFAVVVGKPSTPTPAGLFAVFAELREPDPAEFLGSWVLPLTAHSEVLSQFDGGDGQVALHGRGGASLADPLGTARSHGCVRLANEAIDWIASHVPVGTPVLVS